MLKGSDSWGCIFGHAANNYHKKHTMNADGAQKGRLFQRFLRPALSALLLLHIFAQMAVASTLVLSAPAEMDVSFEGTCWLNFTCSEDALNPFAQLLLPPGFDCSGDCLLIMDGTASDCLPSIAARTVEWDLGDALRGRKHLLINEWDQNPPGSDTGREWIELYNPTRRDADIGGWKIVDSRSAKAVAISAGTSIGPGDYLLLNWTQTALINSDYTSLILQDASGQEVDRTSAGKDEKNSNLCWGRSPNGRDRDDDADWQFQEATPGHSNGGSMADIYSGQSLSLKFNITAGCAAPRQGRLSARIDCKDGTAASCDSDVAVRRANITLSVRPDRYDVARGDTITWDLLLENQGDGAARAVTVNATLDGQQMQGVNSPGQKESWSIPRLDPGSREEISFKSLVTSTQETYNSLFSASWGLPVPCESISRIVAIGPRTAIRKSPDAARRLAVGETAGFAISADLPAGARDLWINDSIPRGLVYNESSLYLQGLSLEREVRATGPDGSLFICRHLHDAPSARQAEISYNCLVENAKDNQDGEELAGGLAAMSWEETAKGASGLAGALSKSDSDAAGTIIVVEPELSLQMNSSRTVASVGNAVTFTLAAGHTAASSSPAYDLDLQIILPANLAYQPGSAKSWPYATFDEGALCWHLAELEQDEEAGQSSPVLFSFNATCRSPPGETDFARARLTWSSRPGECMQERGSSGGINDYAREAGVQVAAASLTLTKAADPDPVQVGETLTYTLTYEYQGKGSASNVVICDHLDPRIELLSAEPRPSISDGQLTWTVPRLENSSIGQITLEGLVNETVPDGALLQNIFNISCDELGAIPEKCIFTSVRNSSRLAVTKSALQKTVRRGEAADFVITVCNRGGQSAANITVRDDFDSAVEVVSVWPETSDDGLWHFATLEPGGCLQMGLSVRVPRTDVTYVSQQNVSGQGFVRAFRDYSTSRPPGLLKNRVYVTADGAALFAEANVTILAEHGTGLSIREHGSGDYQSREDTEYLTANKSIRMNREVDAVYQPAAFSLPGRREQTVSSFWHERTAAKNGITNTTLCESYRYARRLKGESRIALDENESMMSINSSFEGLAGLTAKKTQGGQFSSAEEYAGAFQLTESLHDAGLGLLMDRSVSGSGYADRNAAGQDERGRGMQSRESGTGSLQAEERMEFFSGYMAKDIYAGFAGMSLPVTPRTNLKISQKWSEAMTSATAHSLIDEQYSSTTRLDMKTKAMSPWERQSEAAFSGSARLKTSFSRQNNSSKVMSADLDQEEAYQGDYLIKRRISMAGPARYDRPHLHLVKEGRLAGEVAAYAITLENDGNAALGPLYLQDLFPPKARFINSTLRPARMEDNCSNWTLLHLAIGDRVRIDINLDVQNCSGDIINRAAVRADCSQGPVQAANLSVIFREPLRCCPPERAQADGKGNSSGVGAEDSSAFGCACLQSEMDVDDGANADNDFLSQDLVKAQWDGKGGAEGSCPLNCPEIEKSISSGQ